MTITSLIYRVQTVYDGGKKEKELALGPVHETDSKQIFEAPL
jgi:hypothetical protein